MAKNTGTDRNRRSLFTIREDQLILTHKGPDAKLSKRLGRSVSAIQMRRSRLKKDSPDLAGVLKSAKKCSDGIIQAINRAEDKALKNFGKKG